MENQNIQTQQPVNTNPVQTIEAKKKFNPLMIVMGMVVVILLLGMGYLIMQNMDLQKEITFMKTNQNSIVYSPSPTASMQPVGSACPESFKEFKDDYFSFCQPSDMTSQTEAHSAPWLDANKQAETVTFENVNEKIVINTSFQGGWGGGTCSNERKTIAGYDSAILIWDKEGGLTCSSNLVNLVAVIGDSGSGGNLPIAIDYQQKSDMYLDKTKFDQILSTFKFTN